MLKGIDVSDNNGKIDWQAVKNAGIDFAIIRLGFGNDDSSQDDRRFEENVYECERLNIPWGAYIYSYAMNNGEALSEAAHCLRLLSGKKPSYPVCFDMEDADGYKKNRGGLSAEQMVQICDTFLSNMEEKGYYVALYSSVSWLGGLLNDRRLDRYDKWVAQWNTVCEYSGSYGLWQYGGSTNFIESPYLNGVSGAVDKNYALYDYPTVIKANGLNGWTVVETSEIPEEEPENKPEAEPENEPFETEIENAENGAQNEPDENKTAVSKPGFFAIFKRFLKLLIKLIRGFAK